jgi:hypothetical protein
VGAASEYDRCGRGISERDPGRQANRARKAAFSDMIKAREKLDRAIVAMAANGGVDLQDIAPGAISGGGGDPLRRSGPAALEEACGTGVRAPVCSASIREVRHQHVSTAQKRPIIITIGSVISNLVK